MSLTLADMASSIGAMGGAAPLEKRWNVIGPKSTQEIYRLYYEDDSINSCRQIIDSFCFYGKFDVSINTSRSNTGLSQIDSAAKRLKVLPIKKKKVDTGDDGGGVGKSAGPSPSGALDGAVVVEYLIDIEDSIGDGASSSEEAHNLSEEMIDSIITLMKRAMNYKAMYGMCPYIIKPDPYETTTTTTTAAAGSRPSGSKKRKKNGTKTPSSPEDVQDKMLLDKATQVVEEAKRRDDAIPLDVNTDQGIFNSEFNSYINAVSLAAINAIRERNKESKLRRTLIEKQKRKDDASKKKSSKKKDGKKTQSSPTLSSLDSTSSASGTTTQSDVTDRVFSTGFVAIPRKSTADYPPLNAYEVKYQNELKRILQDVAAASGRTGLSTGVLPKLPTATSEAQQQQQQRDKVALKKLKKLEKLMKIDLSRMAERIVIPEIGAGQFVSRLDDYGEPVVGFSWSNNTAMGGPSLLISSPNTPDPNVMVYTWKACEPKYPDKYPRFNSAVYRLRKKWLRLENAWDNFIQADYINSHIPIVTESSEGKTSSKDIAAEDIYADFIGGTDGAASADSQQTFSANQKFRYSRESIMQVMRHDTDASQLLGDRGGFVKAMGRDGEDDLIRINQVWENGQYPVPAGRRIAKMQMPPASSFSGVSEQQQQWFSSVCQAFGINPNYLVRLRNSSRQDAARTSESEVLRHTVEEARKDMADFVCHVFEDIYRKKYNDFIKRAYTETESPLLREINAKPWRIAIHWRMPVMVDSEMLIKRYKDGIIGPNIIRRFVSTELGLVS